ncbi:MAG TPA: hypothetical protein V6D33_05855, partial [Cyanophyceae cyanobacterium]
RRIVRECTIRNLLVIAIFNLPLVLRQPLSRMARITAELYKAFSCGLLSLAHTSVPLLLVHREAFFFGRISL